MSNRRGPNWDGDPSDAEEHAIWRAAVIAVSDGHDDDLTMRTLARYDHDGPPRPIDVYYLPDDPIGGDPGESPYHEFDD